jgi:bifunctional lysine-specific demethylase and histidyl-hydroxylase NO66
MSLSKILDPLPPAEFFAGSWGRRSLLLPGARGRFSDLFSSTKIGQLLQYLRPKPPDGMALVKGSRYCDSRWTNADGSPHPDRVRAAWLDGYTLVVNNLGRLWEPVAQFAAALTEELHHPVDVNLYYTPPGSQGFEPHFDVMDAFILQLEGSKIWEVRGAAALLPFPDEHVPVRGDRLPPLVFEEELQEGGVLYIPRGHVHAARTAAAPSLHLTVGIQALTWIDLFSAAVAAARQDGRFREALPPGFLNGAPGLAERFRVLAAELPRYLSLEDGLAHLAERSIVAQPPPAGDGLLEPERELGPGSLLRRRPGVLCHMVEGPGHAVIQYSGGKIAGPAKIAPALRYIAAHRSFSASSLPGDLSERERLVLLRRLIRDGLLAVEAEAE